MDWQERREFVERVYSDYLDIVKEIGDEGTGYMSPHCDDLVLHAPGHCVYCDKHPLRQTLRTSRFVAFTDLYKYGPPKGIRPCPAEACRSVETINRWGGNRADNRSDAQRDADSKKYWDEVDLYLRKAGMSIE